jgi:hypothetical protein
MYLIVDVNTERKIAHRRVRMEGWQQWRRLGERNNLSNEQQRTDLTPTGVLKKGVYLVENSRGQAELGAPLRRWRIVLEHLAYNAWSLMDNLEWTDDYAQRYGVTHAQFRNQKRTIKDSGLGYRFVPAANRLDV